MFGSTVLDVGIGLVFVYLIYGLICSAINEHITQWLSLRAETLWASIRHLLADPKGVALAKDLYNHHLVRSLAVKSVNYTQPQHDDPATRPKPSYIPAGVFSMALVERIAAGATKAVGDTQISSAAAQPGAAQPGAPPPPAPPAPPSPTNASELLGMLAKSDLPDAVKEAVRPLIQEAGDSLDKARRNIEAWYDAAMERASGWYKQKVQSIILVIAFLVAFASNADTLMIADRLWTDPAARAQIAADAARFKNAPPETTTVGQASPALQGLLGWAGPAPGHASYNPSEPRRVPATPGEWLLKLIGILLTAFAASLGAPFWFDVLSKFMNVRAAGKSPSEKPARPETKPQPTDRVASG